ncbi:MAG: hypothetical protein F6K42_00975 [Leptolyngbya sp. SIO1D8]|nr:hypothetical protein [Leptolyngbya sp. SIO1D8]
MSLSELTPYLQRLLDLYDEKRKRFQWSFSLLLVGAIAFFFLVFFPYMTLLGNLVACRSTQNECPPVESSILAERFTGVTTSWGNIPISTAEVVMLFPLLVAVGLAAVSAQLIGLMRLRLAIRKQLSSLDPQIDVPLIAPILLDPKRGILDLLAGGAALTFPPILGLFSTNLIFVRLSDLRQNLPYAQSTLFYNTLYTFSAILMLVSLARVALQLLQNYRYQK